jgi:hypothetical protein
MDAETCTYRDLARALGVSETTIKSYRTKFSAFLPIAREGKPVRLHPEALAVCRRIRELFGSGLSIVQTIQALRAEFKEYPQVRRLSTTADGPRGAGLDAGLAEQLHALAAAQEAARQRIELLEAEVRNLATLEAASKSLVAELLGELRAARSVPPASSAPPPGEPVAEPAQAAAPPPHAPQAADPDGVLTARKIVTVHGASGPLASYAFNREPRPEPPFAPPAAPPDAFLDMPAVIRSDRGDFLGLPGGQSVRRLVETLSTDAAPVWLPEGEGAWSCAIPLGRAQTREVLFERTYTPRGNLVGLIRRMRINEAEATPAQLQDIFRQLRDQMA